MLEVFHCPECSRKLARTGELTIDGQQFPVFQCDECVRSIDVFGDGVKFAVALTFAVGADGRPFDPDESRPLIAGGESGPAPA